MSKIGVVSNVVFFLINTALALFFAFEYRALGIKKEDVQSFIAREYKALESKQEETVLYEEVYKIRLQNLEEMRNQIARTPIVNSTEVEMAIRHTMNLVKNLKKLSTEERRNKIGFLEEEYLKATQSWYKEVSIQ